METVKVYDWVVRDDEDDNTNIYYWALDKDVKPYLLKIANFEIEIDK